MLKLGIIKKETPCHPVKTPATTIFACVIADIPNDPSILSPSVDDFTLQQTKKMMNTLMVTLLAIVLIALCWLVMGHFIARYMDFLHRPSHP